MMVGPKEKNKYWRPTFYAGTGINIKKKKKTDAETQKNVHYVVRR